MEEKKREITTLKKWILVIGGIFVGFLSGFFGGGGGMLLVPLLVYAGGLSQKEAHATAQSIILPLSVLSGAVYIIMDGYDFEIGLPVGIAFVVGGIVGSLLLKKIPNKWLGIVFAVLMIVGGVRLLW